MVEEKGGEIGEIKAVWGNGQGFWAVMLAIGIPRAAIFR